MGRSALTQQSPSQNQLDRVPTGIEGLDVILQGGLIRGGIYLVGGRPGTGKTTLGNQLAHNHVRQGGHVLFATVLAENHGRMIAHLRDFDFFDTNLVAKQIQYLSIFDELASGGLEAAEHMLRHSVRRQEASLLIIDGVGLLGDFAEGALEFREFVHDIHTQMSALGCTTLLLTDLVEGDLFHPIGTHVDGILMLEDQSAGSRDFRFVHPVKMRGIDFIRGRHAFEITDSGVVIYPRLEAQAGHRPPAEPDRSRSLRFGIEGLDEMLRGGLQAMSSTLLLGAPGSGKTITGLHFIHEGVQHQERCLAVSFHESPERLLAKAESIGLPMAKQFEDGSLRILWIPVFEARLDEIAYRILEAAIEQRPSRLLVDGMSDIWRTAAYPNRVPGVLSALLNVLLGHGVTVVMTDETHTSDVQHIDLPVRGASAVIDSMIALRYERVGSKLHRLISVVKSRSKSHETEIREFEISDHGVSVAESPESAEVVLSAIAQRATIRDPASPREERR